MGQLPGPTGRGNRIPFGHNEPPCFRSRQHTDKPRTGIPVCLADTERVFAGQCGGNSRCGPRNAVDGSESGSILYGLQPGRLRPAQCGIGAEQCDGTADGWLILLSGEYSERPVPSQSHIASPAHRPMGRYDSSPCGGYVFHQGICLCGAATYQRLGYNEY